MAKTTLTWKPDAAIKALRKAAADASTAIAVVVAQEAEKGFTSNAGFMNRSKPGGFPNMQSGKLQGSIRFVKADANGTAYAGTNLAYGRYLNDGAVIRPRNKKALCFPISAEGYRLLRNAGGNAGAAIERLKAKQTKNQKLETRGKKGEAAVIGWAKYRSRHRLVDSGKRYKNTGNVVHKSEKYRVSDFEPLFLLTKQSVIQARPWLKWAVAFARSRFAGTAAQAFKASFGGGSIGAVAAGSKGGAA